MRPLHIAVLAHCRHPIAPPFMGGMEAHAYHLVHALAARGHRVTLVAAGDSRVAVPVLPTMARHYDADYPWHDFHGTTVLNAHLDDSHAAVLARLRDRGIDVIHNNTLHRFPPRMARAGRVAMVTSRHVPPFDALARAIRDSVAPWHAVTGCSDSHLGDYFPGGVPDQAHVVPNGIDLAAWPFSPAGDGCAVWAGRMTPEKAPHLALAAARAAGVPLTLFGIVENRDYHDAMVAPLLGTDHRYGGHLGGADLAAAFGQASVVLATPQWNEPFGLAAIEAMACGTPVAAIGRGALPGVVGPGGVCTPPCGTGLDRALIRAMDIPRTVPRAHVARTFTLDRMIAGLEGLYHAVIARRDDPFPPVDFPPIELPATLARQTA